MSMFFLAVGFFQGLQADLPDQVDKPAFRLFRLSGTYFYRVQRLRRHILEIHLANLPHPFDGQRILLVAIRQDIPHQVLENVFFDEVRGTLGYLQRIGIFREVLQGIQVSVQFVVQTTFQTTALSA